MSRILVTGGTGFIGSSLVAGLVSKGFDVRVFDNNFRGCPDNLKSIMDKVDLVQGDIRDKDAVKESMRGVQSVFHLSFINGTGNFYKYPDLVMEVGIKGHFNVMEAARESNIETFVYASSSEVYQTPAVVPTPEDVPCSVPDVQNPRFSYGGGKIAGELLTLHYPLPGHCRKLIFRPHNIYGPNMGFEHVIPQIVQKIFLASQGFKKTENVSVSIQGNGAETRAFCYIEDAVKGIMELAQKGEDRQIYNLGKEDEISIIELVRMIGEALEIDLNVEHEEAPLGGTPRRCPDMSKLKQLGYVPNISLRQGLEKTVSWYRNYFQREGVNAVYTDGKSLHRGGRSQGCLSAGAQ